MTRLTWIYLLLALALASVVGYFTLQSVRRSPLDLLEKAIRHSGGASPDLRLAIADLDLAVRLAEVDADDDARARILMERARVLAEMEAWSRARADLQLVLERYRPGDVAVESQLILADLRCGDARSAMRRSERVLAHEPGRVDALTYQGQVLVHMADEAMSECERLIHKALPDLKAAKASRIAHRAAGLPAQDARRVALLLEMRSLFEPTQEMAVRDIVRLLDGASAQMSQAREVLALAFQGPPMRQTLDDFMRLLERSGRAEEMIAFGLAAVHQPGARTYPPFFERLLRAMLQEGRPDLASETMGLHFPPPVPPTPELYDVWSAVLYADRRWEDLISVGARLREVPGHERQSRGFYYTGVAHTRNHQYEYAPVLLTRYLQREPVEPQAGDLATAWHMLALCYRRQGLLVQEKNALRAALRIAPDAGPPAGLGWRRLAQVLAKEEPSSIYEIEHALTQAVRLLPELSAELVPEWEEVCRENLEAAQVDLRGEFQRLLEEGRSTPSRPMSAYEIFSLAKMHAGRRNPAGVIACSLRLLADYPGFLPAIDMLLVATLQIGDHARAAELVLQRLTLDPADKRVLREVTTIPPETWSREQVLQLMRLDPEGEGRMRMARFLHDSGREKEALDGLLSVDPLHLGDEGRLLASRLMLRLGRLEGIDALLEGLTPRSRPRTRALPLLIEASLRRHDRELAQQRIAALVAESSLVTDGWMELVDRMLSDGHWIEAASLLELLDSRQGTRTGETLLRRGVCALLLERPEEAHDHLMRAEAFLEDGAVELGLIQLAIAGGQWRTVPPLVEVIERSALSLEPLQAAALDVLAGRTEAALAKAEGADVQEEPLWLVVDSAARLMRGEPLPGLSNGRSQGRVDLARESLEETLLYLQGDGSRDPREAVALLLALLDPTWRPLVAARSTSLAPTAPGGLWPSYVSARARLLAGNPQGSLDLLRLLMRAHPRFEPAWDLQEQALAAASALTGSAGPPVTRLNELRRTIFGPLAGDETARRWREVVETELAGDHEGAVELARAAASSDGDPVAGSLRLARLHLRSRELKDAADAFEAAASRQEPASDTPIVAEILAAWPQLESLVTTPAGARRLRSLLDDLLRRFPRDPLLALAQARSDQQDPQLSPAIALARSFERLQHFRRTTGNAPLDQLRPGATRAWVDFLLERDPARAEALVRTELLATPGSRDLWRMLGDCLVTQDRKQEAVVLYETLLRMLPDGATGRSLLTLLARSGRRTERVQQLVDQVVRLESLPAPDVTLELERALSLVLQSADTRDAGIDLLADLWSRRETATSAAADIGLAYGTALCWRSQTNDTPLAHQVLREIEGAVTDPLKRNLVRALANLSSH